MRVRGVKKARAKGRIYYYHRKTGRRINAEPGTAEFIREIERLDATPRPSPEREKLKGTWGALVTAYRASPEYAGLAERTKADYQKVFDFMAALDRMPVNQLDDAALLELRDDAFREKKWRFANHVLQVVSTTMNWGKPRKLSDGYPLIGLRKIRIARPVDMPKANRPWTAQECAVVMGEARGGLRVAIALGMYACMRIGDAAAVTWSIYDGSRLEWRQGKTGDDVWVPAHRDLRAILEATTRTATTIVTGLAGLPLKETGLAKAFRTLILRLERAGRIGPGLTFHGLRHTRATELADLGADPRMIQALLGHRSMAASLHYSDRADRRRAAVAAVRLLEQPKNAKLENRRARFGKPGLRGR